jgi:Holliday junction DNA helicase RuvA
MIGYIEGKLIKKENDKILVLANQVGYEVIVPGVVMEALLAKKTGSDISLFIFYYQTERQPKPILIGFNQEIEKEFFQYFISVEDIGPLKAVKAMNMPVSEIARAIESKDVTKLLCMKGIGKRTAQKIIATLEGKMNKFDVLSEDEQKKAPVNNNVIPQILEVLVSQLGHNYAEAKKMIDAALKRNQAISTPEELLDEIYRGGNNGR